MSPESLHSSSYCPTGSPAHLWDGTLASSSGTAPRCAEVWPPTDIRLVLNLRGHFLDQMTMLYY